MTRVRIESIISTERVDDMERSKIGDRDREVSGRQASLGEVERIATTFFFSNFPEHWIEKDFWNLFSKKGSVVDVYLARKRSKDNKRFGFVRFIRVTDERAFERNLGKIWIGKFKLFISLEKFKRFTKEPKERKFAEVAGDKKEYWKVKERDNRSFADVLRGIVPSVHIHCFHCVIVLAINIILR